MVMEHQNINLSSRFAIDSERIALYLMAHGLLNLKWKRHRLVVTLLELKLISIYDDSDNDSNSSNSANSAVVVTTTILWECPSEQQVQLLLDKTFLAEQLIHKMQYFVSAATQEAFYKAKDLLRTHTSSVIFLLKQ